MEVETTDRRTKVGIGTEEEIGTGTETGTETEVEAEAEADLGTGLMIEDPGTVVGTRNHDNPNVYSLLYTLA